MGVSLFRTCRITLIAFYAFSTVVVALLVTTHNAHESGFSTLHNVSAASDCLAGGKTRNSSSIDANCCQSCSLSEAGGVAPVAQLSFSQPHEIITRLEFAQRLGPVVDATPENRRSRAPPAAFA